jgi:hypothetical protein
MVDACRFFGAALAAAFLFVSLAAAAVPAGYTGTPYPPGSAPREIPGRINFHDYDCGGLNVSFYADDRAGQGSWGGTPRTDDGATSWPAFYMTNTPWDHDTLYPAGVSWPNGVWYPDPADTTIHDLYIGASHANSWSKWTVHVSTAGKYWISSTFSAADQPAHFTISFLNGAKTTSVSSGNLSGVASYHAWKKFNDFASITLDTGVQVLHFQNGTGHLNQDFLYFAADSGQFATGINQPAGKAASSNEFGLLVVQNTVHFSIKDAGKTKISVFNCLGKEVLVLLNKTTPAGRHMAALSEPALKKGVYFLRLEHNSLQGVTKFQKTK